MDRSKIEWCDATWNPVTGCLHGCEYCYARRIAERFRPKGTVVGERAQGFELKKPIESGSGKIEPYPFGFSPTLHGYKLDTPKRWTKPRTIFVCSMADLFGGWVPQEWIEAVFAICDEAPQHRYLFLTKNPARYMSMAKLGLLPKGDNLWYGSTATKPGDPIFWAADYHTFVSAEPLERPIYNNPCGNGVVDKTDWIILGAETGNRKEKIVPSRYWVEDIIEAAREQGKPVFMKNSMKAVWGEDLITEFPWDK